MTRIYYRLSLSAICALAAYGAPIWFLEDRPRVGYLLGGLGAALLAWLFLVVAIAAESRLSPLLQGAVGAGLGVLSWGTISLVAVFSVMPHALVYGLARFDPVWVMAGLSPLAIPAVAWWRVRRRRGDGLGHALLSCLFRFSVPLFGLDLVARLLGLPKQYPWLFLFTGVMFLVLDGLGTGDDLPLWAKA